jgi:hypothetical protein
LVSPLSVEVSLPPVTILVEVFVSGGGITFRLQEYLHQFSITFEHKRGCGGDGGGSGDIFLLSLCPKIIA